MGRVGQVLEDLGRNDQIKWTIGQGVRDEVKLRKRTSTHLGLSLHGFGQVQSSIGAEGQIHQDQPGQVCAYSTAQVEYASTFR